VPHVEDKRELLLRELNYIVIQMIFLNIITVIKMHKSQSFKDTSTMLNM